MLDYDNCSLWIDRRSDGLVNRSPSSFLGSAPAVPETWSGWRYNHNILKTLNSLLRTALFVCTHRLCVCVFEGTQEQMLLCVRRRAPNTGLMDGPASSALPVACALLMQPLTLTCLGPPGLATVWEIPRESPWYTCLLDDTHPSMKRGGRVALTNYPHPQYSGVLAGGKTQWPGRRRVDKWKVKELSGEGT